MNELLLDVDRDNLISLFTQRAVVISIDFLHWHILPKLNLNSNTFFWVFFSLFIRSRTRWASTSSSPSPTGDPGWTSGLRFHGSFRFEFSLIFFAKLGVKSRFVIAEATCIFLALLLSLAGLVLRAEAPSIFSAKKSHYGRAEWKVLSNFFSPLFTTALPVVTYMQ